ETVPAVVDEKEPVDVAEVRGSVRSRQLTFTYPNARTPALQEIALAAPAGATVALVGRTGAGKSTLLSLIPRLFDPPPGALRVDGVDARRLPLAPVAGGD